MSAENSEVVASKEKEATAKVARPQAEALLLSRSRSLNLGGVVMLCLLFGMLAGLIWGLIKGVTAFAALVIGGLYGVVFIGGALALIAVLVDWILEKRRK